MKEEKECTFKPNLISSSHNQTPSHNHHQPPTISPTQKKKKNDEMTDDHDHKMVSCEMMTDYSNPTSISHHIHQHQVMRDNDMM